MKLRQIRHVVAVTADLAIKKYIVPTLSDIARIKQNFSRSDADTTSLKIISPSSLNELLLSKHSNYLAGNAVNMLENGPIHSARIVANGRQGVIIGVAITVFIFLAMIAPGVLWPVLHVFLSSLFIGCIVLRLLASRHAGIAQTQVLDDTSASVPIYTVMIALYKEAEVVPQLVEAIKAIDWPHSRLEVLFLCEADDQFTLAAFEQELLPVSFKVISVPGVGPRTKPKALNFGLQLALGEFIGVYDAEDRPHPGQLREAWQRFSVAPDTLACLQAPLVIANGNDSWISRQFAFEYAAQFRGLLPWLASGRFVIPLGGTSNHFRRECLLEIGGWDPFNVTEDAELGSRLARRGYYVEMLSLPTVEDAPNDVRVWLKQRTRWLKGWMQTWLVEMRQPEEMLRRAGLKRFLVYHILTVGLLMSALLFPAMVIFITYALLKITLFKDTGFYSRILIFDLLSIISGFLSFHLLGRAALKKENLSGQILLGLPFYWALISAAAWRALWQLQVAPFLWEKTPHRPSFK
ncbi:glycosyltransferase [Phyllobacterium sp. SB3]|uniref:glycosyltransferase n=1 Tax=Phyllobacterium sp. SB3 TaxID=3156073 RepID=UPI0032AFEACF